MVAYMYQYPKVAASKLAKMESTADTLKQFSGFAQSIQTIQTIKGVGISIVYPIS
jgi:hypothetical protein